MGVDAQLPFSTENERALLGSILIDPASIIRIAPVLAGAGDFYEQRHGWIYDAALKLHEAGTMPDVTTVHDTLVKLDQAKQTGGMGYLAQLINETPSSIHAEHYAENVARYAVRRRIIQASGEIAAEAYNLKSRDPVGFMQRKALEIALQRNGHTPPVREIIGSIFEQVEQWASHSPVMVVRSPRRLNHS